MSLGACLGPMQEMGMNFKHRGTVDCRQNVEMPGFKILVNPNSFEIHETCHAIMERHQHAVVKNLSHLGTGLGISFSQTRASHNKRDGFGTERATFGDETISVASYCFQQISSFNIEQQECCVYF